MNRLDDELIEEIVGLIIALRSVGFNKSEEAAKRLLTDRDIELEVTPDGVVWKRNQS